MPSELRDRAAAEAYVASVCFKHGPPRRFGVELEWIVQHAKDPGGALDADHLADALGEHAPTTLRSDSPNRPLPAGSTVTVEPGGQVEISTPPCESLSELLATATRDAAAVTELVAAAGLRLADTGTDPHRRPTKLLRYPRYDAMYDHYQREGPAGARMMCSSAALQVCLDAGTAEQVALRWRTLYALGPVLVAAFANSPVLAGVATGWASTRMALWAEIGRGAWPPVAADHPGAGYANHVLDMPVLCVRRPDGRWLTPPDGTTFTAWLNGALPVRPTTSDLDYHLTTLFPPVRPQGHLEVRYLDAQPAGRWPLPVAVLVALLCDDRTTAATLDLCAPAADRWAEAARRGMSDPVVAATAAAVFDLACRRLPNVDAPGWLRRELESVTERRINRGLGACDPVASVGGAEPTVAGREVSPA